MLRRLRPLDRVLLFTLVPLWVVCLVLQVGSGWQGKVLFSDFSVSSASGADAYPTVHGVRWTELDRSSGLAPGDLLVRVGESDLRGMNRVDAWYHLERAVDEKLRVNIRVERAGVQLDTDIQMHSWALWWAFIPVTSGSVILGLICLVGAPEWHLSRRVFLLALMVGFFFARFGGAPVLAYANLARDWISVPLMMSLAVWTVYDFPERSPGRRRSVGFLACLFGVWWALQRPGVHGVLTIADETLRTAFQWVGGAAFISWIVSVLFLLTRNYRRTDPPRQRQVKWIIYGSYLTVVPYFLADTLFFGLELVPEVLWVPLWATVALVVTAGPICALVSIFGYRFLDINPLISSTTSYSILGVLVLAGIFTLIPRMAEAAGGAIGVGPSSAQLVLSVALAALAIPVHRSLRPRIDQFFFPERHFLDEGIQHLLESLSDQGDPRDLTVLAGEQLDAQFRPESCVVYAAAGPGFEPVFARGRAVPPAVEALSPLITTLQTRTGPLAADRFSRRDRIEQLSLFDRAALDTLGAAVVVPVRQRGQLVAFLCLGPKRSGDIYTSTDLALLTAVANAVSTQLDRMDQEEITREARAMQQELRRYVPGAVSREVEAGEDLEARERAVTVLFVDIRGYTSYSEPRQAHEVFSTVNRFTQAVSAVIEKLGGSVVEFGGDGMMAIFGAPRTLPDKEKAAVGAGREIISKVQSLGGTGEDISVGIGIASGAAFVGNVQAADRMIWTALGNTTNLAARLQGLTRDLDAAMVIDLATWRAAGEPPEFERREQVAIRGRSQREDVYLLSLGTEAKS